MSDSPYKVTLTITDNGWKWKTTVHDLDGPEAAAQRHARRIVRKYFPSARVRFGKTCRDLKRGGQA